MVCGARFPGFCINRSIPNSNILLFFFSGKPLTEALKLFRGKCSSLGQTLSEANIMSFTEYFFSTFFQHYKLYQFVSCDPQEKLTVEVTYPVDVPESPLPFMEGKSVPVWEYEQKIKAINANAEAIARTKKTDKSEDLQETMRNALEQSENHTV